MQKKIFFTIFTSLISLLMACSDVGKAPEPDLELVKNQGPEAAMTCQYIRHSMDGSHQSDTSWFLLRAPDRVESYDEMRKESQIWQKDQNGLVSEMHVFHSEKLVLEVSNGDLLASGHLPKWATIWSMVDPEEIAKNYKSTGHLKIKDMPVEVFQGEKEGIETDLEWLSPLALPVAMKMTSTKGVDALRLKGCWAPAQGPMQPTTQEQLLAYRHIDFSDLGDMESDPQVQRITKLLGHGHAHEEEGHH